jgi:hypothetical protein
MADSYYVKALWDAEAKVWVSDSNIPGLVIEADTLAEFESLVQSLAPELLADNVHLHNVTVPFSFRAEGLMELKVA